MKKIAMFYFSGTGNTKWVAEKLAEKLNKQGFEIEIKSIDNTQPSNVKPKEFDQIGILFPIHSSIVPYPMQEFLKGLPDGKGTPLFVVQSAWLFGGHTAADYGLPLAEKNYKPYLFANVMMPNNLNLPPFGFLPIKNGKKNLKKLEKAEKRIGVIAEKIMREEPHEDGNNWFSKMIDKAQRSADHRQMTNFFADSKCTNCGWCERNCPVENINLVNGIPEFGDNCIVCVRCFNGCPAEAIQSKWKSKVTTNYLRYKGPYTR